MSDAILCVVPEKADYLSATLFHGLRSLLGCRVVDWPRYDCAYSDYDLETRYKVYGRGFSVFFDLPEICCDRSDVFQKIKKGDFKFIVFCDIANQSELFSEWQKYLTPKNTVLVDGQDGAQVVPHAGRYWRDIGSWRKLTQTRKYLYFKREWTFDSQFNFWHRLLPKRFRKSLSLCKNLRRISFSIPESKIVSYIPEKTKDFPAHIVDAEVAEIVSGSSVSYAFSSEGEYYRDLQTCRFGITTKRGGWDCLRHYEIAANGAVPCFRLLREKPTNCAPHGLIHGKNCIDYSSGTDLLTQIKSLEDLDYKKLQVGAINWARNNSTLIRANEFLDALNSEGLSLR